MTEPTGRRRGDDLERAIFTATLEELKLVGYANLRMEAVAARARAGKASLYKRWPSRAHLVRAAARDQAANADTRFEPTGDVRADLAVVMRRITEYQAGPYGDAIRGYVGEIGGGPDEPALRNEIERPRVRVVTQILEAGVRTGAVRPEALSPRIVNLAPSLMTHHFLTRGEPAGPEVIDEILDLVVMPLVRAGGGGPAAARSSS